MKDTRPIVVKSHLLKIVEKTILLKLREKSSELLLVDNY